MSVERNSVRAHNCKLIRKVHSIKKPFTCWGMWERLQSRQSALTVHCKVHTGEKPYSWLRVWQSLQSRPPHARTIRESTLREKPFICDACGKSFSRIHTFSPTQRVHTERNRTNVRNVGRASFVSSNLYIHQRVHTGEKPTNVRNVGKALIGLQSSGPSGNPHWREVICM